MKRNVNFSLDFSRDSQADGEICFINDHQKRFFRDRSKNVVEDLEICEVHFRVWWIITSANRTFGRILEHLVTALEMIHVWAVKLDDGWTIIYLKSTNHAALTSTRWGSNRQIVHNLRKLVHSNILICESIWVSLTWTPATAHYKQTNDRSVLRTKKVY